MPIDGPKIRFLYHLWDSLFGVIAEFHRNVIFIRACISSVLDIASRQSWLMLGSSVFTDLKISVESLKSQGNLTSSTSGNPEGSLQVWNKLLD